MRVIPEKRWDSLYKYIEYLRHFSAYIYATKYLFGKRILEIGCGTGYGTAYLSEIGFSFIVASDIDKEVLYFINNKYPFKFFLIACDGTFLPFKKKSI